MQDRALASAQDFIQKKPYLKWYTKDYEQLSAESIVESVLTTGDWHDYLAIEHIFGIDRTKRLFNHLVDKKRTNLRLQTRSYFTRYFNTYA